MYSTIVVGVDGSRHALNAVRRAIEVATSLASPEARPVIHLVCAYEPLSQHQVDYLRREVPDEYREQIQPDMNPKSALLDAAALLKDAGVAHKLHDPHGPPSEVILAIADEVAADLLVVGSRGLGAGKRFVLGSVSSHLAQNAPIDVLIVRHSDEEPETVTSALGKLGEAATQFETDHPDFTKTINDVSYFLSGLGI